jgi:hypothetical protein
MSRDHHFEDVVNGESKVPAVIAGEDPNGVAACDANCDSAGVRSRQHAAARNDRTRGHHSGYRGFFRSYASYQNRPAAGGRRKKQLATAKRALRAWVQWRGQGANNLRLAREIRGSASPATHDTTHFRLIGWNCWHGRSFS